MTIQCSGCGMEIPVSGNVCPFCKQDKSDDQTLESVELLACICGAVAGLVIGFIANLITGLKVGFIAGGVTGIIVMCAIVIGLKSVTDKTK